MTGLMLSGWSVLDDDGIRITEVNGRFKAFPGSAGVRLLPDTAAALIPWAPLGRPIAAGNPKRRFPADGEQLRAAHGPADIAGVYILSREGTGCARVVRLGFAEALGTISEHGFHLANEPVAIARQAFERASALAASTPVWQLSTSDRLTGLMATRELIVEIDRKGLRD